MSIKTQEAAIVVGSFGSLSARRAGLDHLGRARRTLEIKVLPDAPGGRPASLRRFDLDDLELFAVLHADASTAQLSAEWPDESDREAIPWALTHALLPGPYVMDAHSDALCTLADAPDAASFVERALGPDVAWLPATAPGPALARLAIARATGRSALAAHAGLLVWGESRAELVARAERLDTAARAFLDASGTTPPRVDTPHLDSATAETVIVSIRGLLSDPDRVVLRVDHGGREVADRPDVDRIAASSSGIEPWSAWRLVGSVVREAASAAGTLDRDTRVVLVPGLGLVTAGTHEADAVALGAVAGHVLRVAAALADRYGSPGDSPEAAVIGSSAARSDPLGEAAPPDTDQFRGRVYIVTGAASGIGRDIARHLNMLGACLGLGDLDGDALDRTADELAERGVRPVVVAGDLTDEAVVDRLVGATIERFGGIDGAVLNAGIAIPGRIKELSLSDWRRSLEVNATSHFILTKRLLPILERQGLGGGLVYIGSKNMFAPGAGFGAYSASKGALAQLARIVALEAGPFGVRSNIVNPDNVFEGSALWSPELRAQRAAVYGIKPDDLEAYYTQRNLLKVPIYGSDVARGVAFMLSDDARRTTACVLTVDGGVPGVFPR
ncbi:MAG: SDR family oxidoreductase [Candidatus Limnocylindrales bacterium]